MKKLMFYCLMVFTSLTFGSDEVLVNDPELVAQLNIIQHNLDDVTSKVMSCIESVKKHSSCLCENKDIIIIFNKSVEIFFKENEEMEQHDLVRFKSVEGEWVTQSLKGIRKQASKEPSCT